MLDQGVDAAQRDGMSEDPDGGRHPSRRVTATPQPDGDHRAGAAHLPSEQAARVAVQTGVEDGPDAGLLT